MKKWLIALSIICGVSLISTAVLAGRVYYKELEVYTDYDKRELEASALNNIYINSSIPIEVYPTTGKPYVEFNQTFSDIMGMAPEYELMVSKKNDSTYIELKEIKDVFFWFGVREDKAKLSVYLPQSTINRLSIQDEGYVNYRREKPIINLEGINVNELDVSTHVGEFILDGHYQKVNISSEGSIRLNSKSPAEVSIHQSMDQHLTGEFKKIKILDHYSSYITIDSNSASQIEIESSHGQIDLRGNYSKVELEGIYNDIDLRSDSLFELVTNGNNNTITANGPFKEISFNEEETRLEVKTTTVPDRVNFGQDSRDNDINLIFPSNIPGFKVKYYTEYYGGEEFEHHINEMISRGDLRSDFELAKEKVGENELVFTHGNGALIMTLNTQMNTLQIIDGGYTSNIAQ